MRPAAIFALIAALLPLPAVADIALTDPREAAPEAGDGGGGEPEPVPDACVFVLGLGPETCPRGQ